MSYKVIIYAGGTDVVLTTICPLKDLGHYPQDWWDMDLGEKEAELQEYLKVSGWEWEEEYLGVSYG